MLKLSYWLDDCLRSLSKRARSRVYLIEALRVLAVIASTACLAYILVDAFHVQMRLPSEFTIPSVGVAVLANLGIYLASFGGKR